MAIKDIFKKKADKVSLKKESKHSHKTNLLQESKDKENKETSSFNDSQESKNLTREKKELPKKNLEKKEEIAFGILKSPHVTEKAGDLVEDNQYVFKVFSKANKTKIKKAIENYYGVDVLSVKIINVPPKKRRLGRIQGKRSGYKKAILKIKKGQKIEIMPR